MARSAYVYFVWNNDIQSAVGHFTVKHEAVTALQHHKAKPENQFANLQLYRAPNGMHGTWGHLIEV